jgi:hypothetical protein
VGEAQRGQEPLFGCFRGRPVEIAGHHNQISAGVKHGVPGTLERTLHFRDEWLSIRSQGGSAVSQAANQVTVFRGVHIPVVLGNPLDDEEAASLLLATRGVTVRRKRFSGSVSEVSSTRPFVAGRRRNR